MLITEENPSKSSDFLDKVHLNFRKICKDKNYEYLALKDKCVIINIPEFEIYNKNQRVERLNIRVINLSTKLSTILTYSIDGNSYIFTLKHDPNTNSILYSILDNYLNHIYLITKHYYESIELNLSFSKFIKNLEKPSYIRDIKINNLLNNF